LRGRYGAVPNIEADLGALAAAGAKPKRQRAKASAVLAT
jgi:hypothetical protein